CGYHGWLDWCQGGATAGIPAATRGLYAELPFNDVARARAAIREAGDALAVVVIEPLVVEEPTGEWLRTTPAGTPRVGGGAAFRRAIGGAAERYGVRPDLVVLGKALANGFPLAAVGGRADLMAAATRTWISSTLATEAVALAAARATLDVMKGERVCDHLHQV